jgi:hypothetical protein
VWNSGIIHKKVRVYIHQTVLDGSAALS